MPAHCWQQLVDGGECRAARHRSCLSVPVRERLRQESLWIPSNQASNYVVSVCVSAWSSVHWVSVLNLDPWSAHSMWRERHLSFTAYLTVAQQLNLRSVQISAVLSAQSLSPGAGLRITCWAASRLLLCLTTVSVTSPECVSGCVFRKLTVACAFTADVLSKDSGECSICLEDLVQGETIARLACLCVYHKR